MSAGLLGPVLCLLLLEDDGFLALLFELFCRDEACLFFFLGLTVGKKKSDNKETRQKLTIMDKLWFCLWSLKCQVSFMFNLSVMLLTFPGEPHQSQATVDLSPRLSANCHTVSRSENEKHNPFVGAALPSYLGLFSITVLNSIIIDPAAQA